MGSPYRRRPSLIRTFWLYRYLIAAAVVLGLLLWFIWSNDAPVTVYFPFRLGQLGSTAGVVILLSALAGSLVTILMIGLIVAVRRIRRPAAPGVDETTPALPEDRPPSDYAAKTPEGFQRLQ